MSEDNDYKLSKIYLEKYKNAGKEELYRQKRKKFIKRPKITDLMRQQKMNEERSLIRDYFLIKLKYISLSPSIVYIRLSKLNYTTNFFLYLLTRMLNNFMILYNQYHTTISINFNIINIKDEIFDSIDTATLADKLFNINTILINLFKFITPILFDKKFIEPHLYDQLSQSLSEFKFISMIGPQLDHHLQVLFSNLDEFIIRCVYNDISTQLLDYIVSYCNDIGIELTYDIKDKSEYINLISQIESGNESNYDHLISSLSEFDTEQFTNFSIQLKHQGVVF